MILVLHVQCSVCSLFLLAFALTSGVVEGERRFPKYSVGERRSPNDIRTRGNGDTLAFH